MGWDDRPLCYRCIADLVTSTAVIECNGRCVNPGWWRGLLAELFELSEGGRYPITINNRWGCTIVADVLYHGSSVCAAHLPVAVMERVNNQGARWPG